MRASSALSLAILVGTAAVVLAENEETGPADFFSSDDAKTLSEGIVSEATKGLFGTAERNWRAVRSLQKLQAKEAIQGLKPSLCAQAALDAGADDVAIVGAALATSAELGCEAPKSADSALEKAKAALDSGNLAEIYYASVALNALANFNKKLDESDIIAVVQVLVDLHKSDGTFGPEDEDDGTLLGAGYALCTLENIGTLANLEAESENVAQIVEKVEDLTDKLMESFEEDPNLQAAVMIIRGLLTLGETQDDVNIAKENMAYIADFLITLKSAAGVDDAAFLVEGLSLFTDNRFLVPLVVTVPTRGISSAAKSAEGFVKVKVTDVMGKPASSASVVLSKAYNANTPDETVLSNQNLAAVAGQPGVFEFNLMTNKLDHGSYTLDLQVTTPEPRSAFSELDSVKRSVRVSTSAAVSSLEVIVADAKTGAESKKHNAEYPQKLSTVNADYTQTVELTFTVKSTITNKVFHPQQAFVKLTHKDSGREIILVTKVQDKKQRLKLVVNDAAADTFANYGGDYAVEILVGDTHIDNALSWAAGVISFTFSADPTPAAPKGAKPELHHTMREPEKRPPALISLAFTAAILGVRDPVLTAAMVNAVVHAFVACFCVHAWVTRHQAGLIPLGLVAKIGLAIRLPSGDKLVPLLLLQVIIALIMGLYTLYWLKLNMFQTLGGLAPLAAAALLCGSKALS